MDNPRDCPALLSSYPFSIFPPSLLNRPVNRGDQTHGLRLIRLGTLNVNHQEIK